MPRGAAAASAVVVAAAVAHVRELLWLAESDSPDLQVLHYCVSCVLLLMNLVFYEPENARPRKTS